MEQETAEYLVDKINVMEDILEKIWSLLYPDQTFEYYGQVYTHIMVELELRKKICDALIPYYLCGLLPESKIKELDKNIKHYQTLNKKE